VAQNVAENRFLPTFTKLFATRVKILKATAKKWEKIGRCGISLQK
tara:strand:- start:887 stop:1021 length:135 start_codon:yes stop_codon:yes gene_type:complete